MIARLILCFFAMLVVGPDGAQAGAWPRDEGGVFVSGQIRQDTLLPEPAPVFGIYGEYGLTGQWTVGGKLDYAPDRQSITQMKAFARWHLSDAEGAWPKAMGLAAEGTVDDPFIVPSLHLGHGFDSVIGPGWLDVEVAANLSVLDMQVDYSLFALVGVKPAARLMTMMAVDLTTEKGGTQVDLIPSLAWEIKDGKHVQLEWTYALDGAVKSEVAAGIWLQF